MKKTHSVHDQLLEQRILWLQLWDNSHSKKAIQADIPLSINVLKNTKNSDHRVTKIESILDRRNLNTKTTVYLNKRYSIPLAYHSIFTKLMNFIETNDLHLIYSTKVVKSLGDKVKLPQSYTLDDNWAVDTYTLENGKLVKKAISKHPDTDKHKLIIANKSSFKGAFIDYGKLGLTGSDKVYIMGENLTIIQKILGFKISSMISSYTKYRQDFLDKEALAYIPDIRKLGILDIIEEEFYKKIGLTEKEIDQINTHI